jgi:hypothetical protein
VTYGFGELDTLIPTGVTRGKRLVVLVRRRWSKLDEWLRRGRNKLPS